MKTQIIRKALLISAVLLIFISYNGNAQNSKTPSILKTFNLDQPGVLNASSSGGGIIVIAHSLKKVEIQVFVRKNGKVLSPSDPMLANALKGFDLMMEKNGSTITIDAKHKSFSVKSNNVSVSFTIKVPQEMSCNISSSGGGLQIANVKGRHVFSSSGGGIQLENISGITKAKSSGGGLNVINQTGDIHLSSSGGGISLTESRGNIFAHSSGGGVRLKNIHGDVDASSSGGSVSVIGASEYVKAFSSGGSIQIDISNLSKEIYLVSSGGGIDAIIRKGNKLGLDLDLSSDHVNINLNNFTGRAEKKRVKGTMNNGGIPVYMHSSGGSINVHLEN